MTGKGSKDYGVDAIEWLVGPEGVRKRPAMYLGGTDSAAVSHMAVEIVGNSNDEAENGHGKSIGVFFGKDGYITVWDEGRGIPVGPHPKNKKIDTLTVVATELHAGGKMNADSYKTSIGTHGVGMAVVNALSAVMELWSWRNNQWNYQQFKKGVPTTKVLRKDPPKLKGVTFAKKGTITRFIPDLSCFAKDAKFVPKKLVEWIDNVSWLLPVKYSLHHEDTGKVKVIHRPNGLKERFDHECKQLGGEPLGEPYILRDDYLDVVIGWVAASDSTIFSSVSAAQTTQHGTHVDGLMDAIKDCLDGVAPKGSDFTKDSVKKGLVAIINVKMHEPKFSGQSKEKLVTKEAATEVYERLCWKDEKWGPLYSYLRKSKDMTEKVIARAVELTRLKSEFRATAALAAELKTEKRGKTITVEGLLNSTTKDPNERELFLVEGKSAGGTAGKARDTKFQEVLPLRGKIPNIWKLGFDEAVSNAIIIRILRAIGYDPKNPGKYRVGKVMLLMDADDDGAHITALMLGLLWAVTPDLVKSGRVYIVNAPLYVYQLSNGKKMYGSDLRDIMKKVGKGFATENVQRLKGWGETNAGILGETAFNPTTRKLTKALKIVNEADLQMLVDMLGSATEARKVALGLAA